MKTLKLLAILLGGLLMAIGCSKNQRRTNKLDGKWDVTKVEIFNENGSSSFTTDPDGNFDFHSCNLRKDDFCPYTEQLNYVYGSTTVTTNATGEYKFDDKGMMLVLRTQDEDGSVRETNYHVLDFKHDLFRVENTDNARTIYTLER